MRYFNDKLNKISSAFASLSSSKKEVLFQALEDCLSDLYLTLANCVGYGPDGASVGKSASQQRSRCYH